MRAQEYLEQYERLTESVRRIRHEIEAIEAQIGGRAQNDGTPHGSGVSDATGTLAATLADIKNEYAIAEAQAWRKRREIVSVINDVTDSWQSRLLYARYIKFRRWWQVAREIHANESYTRGRLHDAALEAVEKILQERGY